MTESFGVPSQAIRRLTVVVSSLSLLLFSTAAASAQELVRKPGGGAADAAASVALRDGVVVDLERRQAYVMTPEGGIEAVDLGSGGTRWASLEASKPLAVADGALVAQRTPSEKGSLAVAVLDAENGRLRFDADVAIAAEVWASVEDGPATSFRSSAAAENGSVVVSWRHTGLAGGDAMHGYLRSEEEDMVPALDDSVAPRRAQRSRAVESSGALRLDPSTGATEPLATLRRSASLELTRSGDLLAGVPGQHFLSVDGRHVLASERIENPTSPWELYRWTIYDQAGERVGGEILSAISMSPFVFADGAVVFVSPPSMVVSEGRLVDQPMALQKVDMSSGATLWTKAVRDVEYRGPMAP